MTTPTTNQEQMTTNSTVTFGSVSTVDRTTISEQSQPPQQRRGSAQSNHSVGDHSPAQSPHYQHTPTNNNDTNSNNNHSHNRHYGTPRHYNQNKHMNTNYSPNMSNAQPGYHHGKKPMSPHTSPSAKHIPLAQNSWTNSIPGQYYASPTHSYEARPQYYGYNNQSYPRQGGQQNFVPQGVSRTSKAIPIINPETMTPVKADPLAPALSSSSSPSSSDKKDIKTQPSPSPKRPLTIVDPAVKEREEREKQEKEEAERLAKEQEAERLAKEEAERLAKEQEAERLAKEQEAERLAKEQEAERLAKQEAERLVKEQEAERLAKQEADRLAKEQEALAKQEADRLAKEQQALAKQEADRLAKEEADRKVREERAAANQKMVEDETNRLKRQLAELNSGKQVESEEQRIANISAEKAARPAPGRLDLSGIPAHVLEGEPQTQSPSSPTVTVKKVEIPRRKIADFDSIQYPEGVSKTPTNSTDKIQYDIAFLMQFKPLCLETSVDLSAFEHIGEGETNERSGSSRGGNSQRRQPSERGNRGSRTPGGGNDMYRNNSRDGRQDSMGKFAGGRPLAHRAGSSGMSSPGSPGGGMQRDGSHGGRTRSGRGGGKGRHPPREQQGGPTIPLDQVVPLEKSENRWMPAVVATGGEVTAEPVAKTEDDLIPQDVVIRKVKSLLNKLTLEKFDSISTQIYDYAHQSAKEKEGETLLTVIQLIFDKACDEAAFASMWAQLCRKLHDTIAAADDIRDENNVLDKHGKPVTSGHLFRKYLFNRCQQAFERGWKFDIPDLEKSVSGEVMMTDEYYAAVKAKRQGLGLVQFIGELFKRGMLIDRIMTECLTRLCRDPQNAEDEETETMCKLVTTVGRELDNRNRNMRQWMDAFFERMKEMLECTTLTSRVKFMIQDVIELRKHNWVPRSGKQTGPSTIAQIREEAQKAKTEGKEAMKRTSSSRGNTTPQVMSRQGSRAGRNNSQREGSTNNNSTTTTSDGWSTVGTSPVSTPKGRTNDLDGFGRTDRSKSRTNVLGPGSSPFQTLNRPGAKNTKSDSKKNSPADSRSASPASSSMSNMFSALGGDDDLPEQPTERKKLNLLPRGSTLSNEESVTTADETEAVENTTKPELTEQQMEQKAKDIIEEYILLRDAKELVQCVEELQAPVQLVNKMLAVVEKKEDDVKGVCEMITILNKDNLVTKENYIEALQPFMEMYEDLTIDVPQAPKYMSQLLVAMNVDPAEVMEIEEPYDTGYVPASAKLKQLVDAAKTSA
ncbi:hypothetical protein BC941DRAFT_404487 [Chlamydoabsidia padenii]|nr:hypothetical protein BC941DRAFT_404487 [Chlamydoabsidia padenii]